MANFALFDLVGKQLSPRIRDLGKITLHRIGPRADIEARYPHAGPLLTRRLNTGLVAATWDDLLAHIWPSHHENINFYGSHAVDVDQELAKLDAGGYRPLRAPGER